MVIMRKSHSLPPMSLFELVIEIRYLFVKIGSQGRRSRFSKDVFDWHTTDPV